MLRTSLIAIALIAALGACSKDDEVATTTTPAPQNTLQPAINPSQNDVDDTARMPEPESAPERSGETAAVRAEPAAKERERPKSADNGARRTDSVTARRWNEFQAVIEKCVTVDVSAREQCL